MPRQLRVPVRRAVLRAQRRVDRTAWSQALSRRGARFHWSDGASSQALERAPKTPRSVGQRRDNERSVVLALHRSSPAAAELHVQLETVGMTERSIERI